MSDTAIELYKNSSKSRTIILYLYNYIPVCRGLLRVQRLNEEANLPQLYSVPTHTMSEISAKVSLSLGIVFYNYHSLPFPNLLSVIFLLFLSTSLPLVCIYQCYIVLSGNAHHIYDFCYYGLCLMHNALSPHRSLDTRYGIPLMPCIELISPLERNGACIVGSLPLKHSIWGYKKSSVRHIWISILLC
jgi:hypothetical protein